MQPTWPYLVGSSALWGLIASKRLPACVMVVTFCSFTSFGAADVVKSQRERQIMTHKVHYSFPNGTTVPLAAVKSPI